MLYQREPRKPTTLRTARDLGDYEEITALEIGIDNCVTLSVTVSKSKKALTVNLTNVAAVDHLELYLLPSPGVYNWTNISPAIRVNIPMSGCSGTYY